MRILVTGAFGYVGPWVVDYFDALGHQLTLQRRSQNSDLDNWAKKHQVVQADLTQADQVKGICKDIDSIIHLASPNEIISKQEPQKALMTNAWGTRNLLEDATSNQVQKFIYLSTFHVYGQGTGVINEDTACTPKADYATTHLFGEGYCHQFSNNLPTSILRLTNGYGAPKVKSTDRWSLILLDLCKMAIEQNKLVMRSNGWQKRDFVWLGDLCHAMNLVLEQPSKASSIYNVGQGASITMRDLAAKIQKVYTERTSNELPLLFSNPEDQNTPDPNFQLEVSIEKLKDLGYSPQCHLEKEIHKTFDLLEA